MRNSLGLPVSRPASAHRQRRRRKGRAIGAGVVGARRSPGERGGSDLLSRFPIQGGLRKKQKIVRTFLFLHSSTCKKGFDSEKKEENSSNWHTRTKMSEIVDWCSVHSCTSTAVRAARAARRPAGVRRDAWRRRHVHAHAPLLEPALDQRFKNDTARPSDCCVMLAGGSAMMAPFAVLVASLHVAAVCCAPARALPRGLSCPLYLHS